MGGINLEIFKVYLQPSNYLWFARGEADARTLQFGLYIMFPIGWMYYFGVNPEQRFSVPDFWPKPEQTNRIPYEREDIKAELDRLKRRRLELREQRLQKERQWLAQRLESDREFIARIPEGISSRSRTGWRPKERWTPSG